MEAEMNEAIRKCHNIQVQVRKAWPRRWTEDGKCTEEPLHKKVKMFFKLCLNSVAITLWGLVALCRLTYSVHIRFYQNICCFSDDSLWTPWWNNFIFLCILLPTILYKKWTKEPEYAPTLNKIVVIIMIMIPVTYFTALQSCVYLWKISLTHFLIHILSYGQNCIY